jgi:hypothetical protein
VAGLRETLPPFQTRLVDQTPLGRPGDRIRIRLDGGKQILKIVFDAGGCPAEGLHLLSLPKLNLRTDAPCQLGIGKRTPALQPHTQ